MHIYLKKVKEKFPDLVQKVDMQVQQSQRISNKMDPKRATSRHIIIKMLKVKDKEKILKAARKSN